MLICEIVTRSWTFVAFCSSVSEFFAVDVTHQYILHLPNSLTKQLIHGERWTASVRRCENRRYRTTERIANSFRLWAWRDTIRFREIITRYYEFRETSRVIFISESWNNTHSLAARCSGGGRMARYKHLQIHVSQNLVSVILCRAPELKTPRVLDSVRTIGWIPPRRRRWLRIRHTGSWTEHLIIYIFCVCSLIFIMGSSFGPRQHTWLSHVVHLRRMTSSVSEISYLELPIYSTPRTTWVQAPTSWRTLLTGCSWLEEHLKTHTTVRSTLGSMDLVRTQGTCFSNKCLRTLNGCKMFSDVEVRENSNAKLSRSLI